MANVKQNIQDWKEKLNEKLQEKNAITDLLAKAEEKTGVSRLNLTLGLGAALALYLMVGYGAEFLCNFLGFVYPAYASVKAIESHEKDDDTKWLTYWVVYSAFALVEFFADIFLFWIPFYWFFKCLFLIYLMVPTSWNGSIFIYTKFIRPFVLKHESKIDEGLEKAKDIASDVIDEAGDTAKQAAGEATGELIKRHVTADSSTKED